MQKNSNCKNLQKENRINKYKNKYFIKIINIINFFIINLLDTINNKRLYILLFIFINNIYILIYGNLIKYNYKILKKIYKEYKK